MRTVRYIIRDSRRYIVLRDLDDLQQLVIRGYPDTLFLARLVSLIQHKRVRELILENLPHLVWQGDEISRLNYLTSLSLSGLNLKEIRREDLPDNVEHLENLWLKLVSCIRSDFPPVTVYRQREIVSADQDSLSPAYIAQVILKSLSHFHDSGRIIFDGCRMISS